MNKSTCKALVTHCIDFRFIEYIRNWTIENIGVGDFDVLAAPGSTKNLDTLLTTLEIAVHRHQITEVYLIHHEDCLAYGAEGTYENHCRDLNKAKEVIAENYPSLTTKLFYLTLTGEFKEV